MSSAETVINIRKILPQLGRREAGNLSSMSKPPTHEEQLATGVTTFSRVLTVNLRQPSVSTEGLPTSVRPMGISVRNCFD